MNGSLTPKTYPTRNNDVIRYETSVDCPNSWTTSRAMAVGADEANVLKNDLLEHRTEENGTAYTLTVITEQRIVTSHLYGTDQFWGLFGSSGLSQDTITSKFSKVEGREPEDIET